jgi:hypothetical protein
MGRNEHADSGRDCPGNASILPVPYDFRDITPAWLSEALKLGGVLGGAFVSRYSADAIAEGKGFMNQLFRLTLDYTSGPPDLPRTLIVKLPSTDRKLRTIFDRLGQNRREVGFYRELAASENLSVPTCYYSALDPETENTVLLLEDLTNARQGDSVAGCSLDDAHRAIVHLARFQATWWENPRLDELDWMPLKRDESDAYLDIYPAAWESLIHQAGRGMPPSLRQLGDTLRPHLARIKARLTRRPRTIVHGDYRLDNCFFDDGTESKPPVVLDWEFCVRGRGVCDVATFISEAFPVQQRREVERDLVATYHTVLLENGVNDYSLQECWRDYRLAMLEIFVFWIVAGGYCDYDGQRATTYLHNTLARFDEAISDLGSAELIRR